jgi:hypothetical protein
MSNFSSPSNSTLNSRLHYEPILEGYRVYLDKIFLQAILYTKHHTGLTRNGGVIYEPMEKESWSIHWTSPSLSVDVVKAVAATLPLEA